MLLNESESQDFKRGEQDGRNDGAKGVKALGADILKRHYSSAYQEGYRAGYDKASEPRRLRAEAKI